MLQARSQTFAQMLQALRLKAGFATVEDLADEIEERFPDTVSDHDIRKYESGAADRVPSEQKAAFLAQILCSDGERDEFLRQAALARAPRRKPRREFEALLKRLGQTIARRDSDDDARLLMLLNDDVPEIAQILLGAKSDLSPPRLEVFDSGATHVSVRNVGGTEARDATVVFPGPAFSTVMRALGPGDTEELPIGIRASSAQPVVAEFRNVEKKHYLQDFSNDSKANEHGVPLYPLRERLVVRARCWFDINRFIMRTLKREPFRFTRRNTAVETPSNWMLNDVLARLQVSDSARSLGFEILNTPERMREKDFPEMALMSNSLNDELWRGCISAAEDPLRLEQLEVSLRAEGAALELLLQEKYASTFLKDNRFFNEEKLCLADDVCSPDRPVNVFKATYYHGFVTNEFVSQRLEVPLGNDYHAGFLNRAFSKIGDHFQLSGIYESNLSNHVGATTLLATSDGWIVLWRQTRGEHSLGKIQGTGSGSCDWLDWQRLTEPKSLTAVAIAAMERELREESGMTGKLLSHKDIDTRLIAYFRWVRRGGKPEFVGLSRSNVNSKDLTPDATECDLPSDKRNYLIDARSPDALREGIERILNAQGAPACSLPLWVGLTALARRCSTRDKDLHEFLWG